MRVYAYSYAKELVNGKHQNGPRKSSLLRQKRWDG